MQTLIKAFRQLRAAVAADHEQIRRFGAKYDNQTASPEQLPRDVFQKIGFQMIAAVRVMQALDAAQVPLLPKLASRLIRHLYGAEIHWCAKIDAGVVIVHGCGLVISQAARVGSGCLLFHNVTLGVSMDPETREIGAPTLGQDVHIGPGATLLGPIVVGDRSKIMAGAVLNRSVPPDSLVRPGEVIITTRRKPDVATTATG